MVKRWIGLAVLLCCVGCSKESLLRSNLADAEDRKDTLELTLKIFDEHPEYVDDLFEMAREHDATFDRLIAQAAVTLEDEAFAKMLAGKLATQPRAVELVTRAILAEARTNPELRAALARALIAEPDVMNTILSEHPQIVRQVLSGGKPEK